ncbi:hypothetical protein Zm00014a_023837 [Zea mays]|jgi:hypothetical protein|nr:hypothetical protein Zm00014a_023837 [Zea mays]
MVKSGFGRPLPLPPPLAWSRRGAGHGENVHGASRASARSSAESGAGAGAGAGGGEGGEKASFIPIQPFDDERWPAGYVARTGQ